MSYIVYFLVFFCRNFPTNFILLAFFTGFESVIVGQVGFQNISTKKRNSRQNNSGKVDNKRRLQAAIRYDGEVVMIAMAATALLVIALTLFAFQVTPSNQNTPLPNFRFF